MTMATQTPTSRGSRQDSKTETVILGHEQTFHEPQVGFDDKTNWLGVRQP